MTASTYHHGNLREALVSAGVEVVREHGADALALRDLARRVGVSHNAAYRHFAGRDDLLAEVAGRGAAELMGTMTRRLESVTVDDLVLRARMRLAEVGRSYVEFAVREPGLFRLAVSAIADVEASPPYLMLAEVLDDLVAVGYLAPEARRGAEIACWSGVHGFSCLAIDGTSRLDHDAALEVLLTTIDRSYGATTGQVASPLPGPAA
ncbi:MAG: TetR/AcrR family transcriptional regulator [Aeromicrobium erythreum]